MKSWCYFCVTLSKSLRPVKWRGGSDDNIFQMHFLGGAREAVGMSLITL